MMCKKVECSKVAQVVYAEEIYCMKGTTLWGGMSDPPSWDEYLEVHDVPVEHMRAIRNAIIDEGLVNTTAENICNDIVLSIPADLVYYGFTWRGWGDLIQAIHDKREGYMEYYM